MSDESHPKRGDYVLHDTCGADYAAGFRAGAMAMREAAAQKCEQLGTDSYGWTAAADIRALPLPEVPK